MIDIGGGDSRLVDHLTAAGIRCIAVLDVSHAALERAKARVGSVVHTIDWIEADVTSDWSSKQMDIWHDRAVFHFLTDAVDRERYRSRLFRTLKVGGSAIIATFALDGPEKCSGLPVMRYSAETLANELGGDLRLVESVLHQHVTPWGATRAIEYARLRREV